MASSDLSLKQLVSWGDHLKVDQPQIDAQHQAIFDIALEMADLWHKHGDLGQVKALAEKLDKGARSAFPVRGAAACQHRLYEALGAPR
jgi:hypothetical protein